MNRCVCIKSECQRVEMNTLLDSGCPVNLVFKNAFERMSGVEKECAWAVYERFGGNPGISISKV